MEFSEIETRRAKARIDQKELCQTAGVHATTYSRLKVRPGGFGASERTLKKLKAALDKLAPEKEQGHGL